jgi:hypothetical protein
MAASRFSTDCSPVRESCLISEAPWIGYLSRVTHLSFLRQLHQVRKER